jgi:alkanesulfonate monooxygenase SsuD/methylene tetrahydromethanopterin reductase-like flavin-dependent oxidoreductase (luciferase family)
MGIGLMHITPHSKADPAKVARRPEELGFESYWVGDHAIVPVESSIPYLGAKHNGREPYYVSQLPDPLCCPRRR